MICPRCKASNPPAAGFCMNCGAFLASVAGAVPVRSAGPFVSEPWPVDRNIPQRSPYPVQGMGQERVLFHTDGGIRPARTGSAFYYIQMGAGFLLAVFMGGLAALLPGKEAGWMVVFVFICLLGGCISLTFALIRTYMAKRINLGKLDITNNAVEGLASEGLSNGFDFFVNPVMTRILLQEINSAGPTVDGAMLLVRTRGREYAFATPDAARAGALIMDLVRTARRW